MNDKRRRVEMRIPELTEQADDIHRMRRENARLRAALKPVLDAKREDCDCGAEWAIRCMNAVNEAQMTYEESK